MCCIIVSMLATIIDLALDNILTYLYLALTTKPRYFLSVTVCVLPDLSSSLWYLCIYSAFLKCEGPYCMQAATYDLTSSISFQNFRLGVQSVGYCILYTSLFKATHWQI